MPRVGNTCSDVLLLSSSSRSSHDPLPTSSQGKSIIATVSSYISSRQLRRYMTITCRPFVAPTSMAAQIATRRAAVSALLCKPRLSQLRPIAAVRSLSSSAQPPDRSDQRALDVDRRPDEPSAVAVRRPRRGGDVVPSFFDAFDPFNPGRSVGQLLSFMDQMMENPFAAAGGGGGGEFRRGWSAWEDDDALYIRVEMPGLGKEDVRVTAEQNAVVIKGEKEVGEEEEEEEEGGGRRRYSGRIELPAMSYRLDAVKAEMRNGLLKVVVPKVKEEEREGVIQVPVE